MVVKERRQASPVSDGLDVTAQLAVQIAPADKSEHLTQAALKGVNLHSTPETARLSLESKEGGWEIAYDRTWYVYRDKKDLAAAVLRRIERGEMIAQCNLSALTPANPANLVSLEQFQDDIKQALGEEFHEFITAGQSADDANRRVLRVAARGKSSDLPVAWTYYHLADRDGRQMSFVFTMEEKNAETFGKADLELVGAARFTDAKK
jgi:hypothetical protein